MMRKANGFTLIEIAIVLVIIGLLLGGVLKGQELITGARVRNLISQQDGVKAAFFGFQDRYRALPGGLRVGDTNINCPVPGLLDGNGNGRIEAPNLTPAGIYEDLQAWSHLTGAGFLNGNYAAGSGVTAPTDATSPKNPYSVYMQIVYDGVYGIGTTPNTPTGQTQREDRWSNPRGDHRRSRPQNRRRQASHRCVPILRVRSDGKLYRTADRPATTGYTDYRDRPDRLEHR